MNLPHAWLFIVYKAQPGQSDLIHPSQQSSRTNIIIFLYFLDEETSLDIVCPESHSQVGIVGFRARVAVPRPRILCHLPRQCFPDITGMTLDLTSWVPLIRLEVLWGVTASGEAGEMSHLTMSRSEAKGIVGRDHSREIAGLLVFCFLSFLIPSWP